MVKLFTALVKYTLCTSLILSSLAGFTGYQFGKASFKTQVIELEAKLQHQQEVSNEHTRTITVDYQRQIQAARARLGSPRPNLESVRVLNSCPSDTEAPREASGTPEGAPSVSQESVSQPEWERINEARFTENLIQLQALRSFVDSLYRDFGSR